MASFANFSNILPDPANLIGLAGQVDAGGTAGPGYSDMTLRSMEPIMTTIDNSGRIQASSVYYHRWELDVEYNDLISTDFHIIYSFLLGRQNSLEPFLVPLPQYAIQGISNVTSVSAETKGTEKILITGTGIISGAIFTTTGETKIYMVTRVETNSEYFTPETQPTSGQERIHFTPALQKDISSSADIIFSNPQLYVTQIEEIKYMVNKDNLYSFGLKVGEVVDA